MIILGIDPGTAIVGWGVLESGKTPRCIAYGVITTEKTQTDSARLKEVFEGITEVLAQFKPDVVSVEKLFFSKNQTTAMTVSQARGVLLLAVEQYGCRIVEFNPMQVKMALTGYGKANKKQMQEMARTLLGLEEIPKPDDAADALAIALAGATVASSPLYR